MKRRLLALLLTVMVGVTTACGTKDRTDGGGTDPSDQAAEQAPDEQTEETEDPVTLSFTYWGGSYEQPLMEKLIADFEDVYPHIQVDSQHIPSDYGAKMSAMVAGKEEPDLAYIQDYMALDFAEQDMLYNIFDLIDEDEELDKEDFVKDYYLYWDEGKSYGLYTAGEAYALFYNTEALKRRGWRSCPRRQRRR